MQLRSTISKNTAVTKLHFLQQSTAADKILKKWVADNPCIFGMTSPLTFFLLVLMVKIPLPSKQKNIYIANLNPHFLYFLLFFLSHSFFSPHLHFECICVYLTKYQTCLISGFRKAVFERDRERCILKFSLCCASMSQSGRKE